MEIEGKMKKYNEREIRIREDKRKKRREKRDEYGIKYTEIEWRK